MAPLLRLTLLVLSCALILATLLPLWRHDAWWVRAFEFPRVQLTVAMLLLSPALAWLARTESTPRIVLVLLAACLAVQAYRIFPYTPLAPRQVLDAEGRGTEVSIMVANVWMPNRRVEPLLAEITRLEPDLVLAVEIDFWWKEELGSALGGSYPFSVEEPLENTYGMALYSRLRLLEAHVEELVEPDVPSIHALFALADGREVRLHGLHPKPPYPAETDRTTERDGELLVVGRRVGLDPEPTILAGDLNDVAWSYSNRLLQRISGLLDPRRGRGLFSTFHADYPFLRWPLDHILHTVHFRLLELRRLGNIGSDHFPIFARLELDSTAPREQEEPRPAPGDRDAVREKVNEADAAPPPPLEPPDEGRSRNPEPPTR